MWGTASALQGRPNLFSGSARCGGFSFFLHRAHQLWGWVELNARVQYRITVHRKRQNIQKSGMLPPFINVPVHSLTCQTCFPFVARRFVSTNNNKSMQLILMEWTQRTFYSIWNLTNFEDQCHHAMFEGVLSIWLQNTANFTLGKRCKIAVFFTPAMQCTSL